MLKKNQASVIFVFGFCFSLVGIAPSKENSRRFELRLSGEATAVIVPDGERLVLLSVWHKRFGSKSSHPRCTVDGQSLASDGKEQSFSQGLTEPLILEAGVYRFATETDSVSDWNRWDGGVCFFQGTMESVEF